MRDETKNKVRRYTYPSIAILPFVNRAFSNEHEYLGDGISEAIINALSRVEGLKVVARTSSFAFKNQAADIREIGAKLGVHTILEGSIRRYKDRVRIMAQLVSVKDGFQLWSETFDRNLADMDTIQDEISALITDKLRENLGHLELEEQIGLKPRLGMSAYQGYLKARHMIQKMNRRSIEAGIEILQSVIEIQPGFSLPYLELHLAYSMLGSLGAIPRSEAAEKARFYLDKAIKIDPDLPECQNQLARVSLWKMWDLKGVYRHLNQALKRRPGYADAYQTLGITLLLEGKLKAAMNAINKAIELDPLSALNHFLKAFVFFTREDYGATITQIDSCLAIDPDYPFAHQLLIRALIMKAEYAKAMDHLGRLKQNADHPYLILGVQTLLYAKIGEERLLQIGIVELEKALNYQARTEILYFLILVYIELGQYDKAIRLGRLSLERKSPVLLFLFAEPTLKQLQGQSPFQAILEDAIKKPFQQEVVPVKYQKSSLRPEDIDNYHLQLQQLMIEKKPYLDRQLSLRQLAQMMDIHPNHLSQLLNDRVGCNFSEFVNAYRLAAFKRKAEDPANRHLTILALAMESGFNSKTVFNTYFKRETGLTPREYWKMVQGNKVSNSF